LATAVATLRAATIGFGLVALAIPAARATDLSVTIKGIRSNNGAVMVGVYSDPQGYADAVSNSSKVGQLNDPRRLVGVSLRANAGDETMIFAGLPPGSYAVIAFHDENDNGRLDENGWGVPLEGYGFSNGAMPFLSAPSFADAAVPISGNQGAISIMLAYPSAPSSEDMVQLHELQNQ